mmetsp:Transcript_3699/g.10625  ORF Transcript_3699/g.10625 Transcript_3699/m.10625 type:complete len:580 (-) Transcript_3699:238-1977(-)
MAAPSAAVAPPEEEEEDEGEMELVSLLGEEEKGAPKAGRSRQRRRARFYDDGLDGDGRDDDLDAEPTVAFLRRLAKFLYGDLPDPATQATMLSLAATLAVLIGGFWLLDSVKDSIFVGTVGLRYLPWAKPVSVCVSLLAVLGYTRLTEVLPTPRLFGLVGVGFGVVFALLSVLLAIPGQGPSAATPHSPGRLLGWVCYCAIESYGSVAVALFWAFTNDTVDLETAKSSYGIIIALAQVGAIAGASVATHARVLHSYGIFLLGAAPPVAAAFMLRRVAKRAAALKGESDADGGGGGESRKKAPVRSASQVAGGGSGIFDAAWSGLRLVITDPYVLGLLLVSSISEVVLTVLDFQLKAMGATHTGAAAGAEGGDDLMTSFMARFGQLANLVSLFMSLFGTSLTVRGLGVRGALMVFPLILVSVVGTATLAHGTTAMLPFLVGGVAVLKGLTYALHEPLKEMLYKPTSAEVKFKARAWIDVFASRGAKAIGASINAIAGSDPYSAGANASLGFSLCVAIGMLLLARIMGRAFDEGMRNHEEGGGGEGKGLTRQDSGETAVFQRYRDEAEEDQGDEWDDYATV